MPTLQESIRQLSISAHTYAALGAFLEARASGRPLDPRLEPHIHDLLAAAGLGPLVEALTPAEARPMASEVQSMMLHYVKLPFPTTASSGWDHVDDRVLQATGEVSAGFAHGLKGRIAPALDGLTARLEAPGATFLDIGVGVAALSIGMARLWPGMRIVGLDPWAPSIALARANVERAGLADRIELRQQSAADLADEDAFDLVWVPTAFIPDSVIDQVFARAIRAVKPGGWLLAATVNAMSDPIAAAQARLLLAQFGGQSATPEDTAGELTRAGLTEVRVLPAPPTSVVAMVAGRRRT